jgi:hypothetical protein
METRLVNPNDCKFIQSRVLLDPKTVLEYAAMMDAGVAFDPCKGIITDTGAILVYDGNHRGEAAKINGSMLEVELMRGTDQDATWWASGANTRHGLRRTSDDIVKSVKEALAHPHSLGKSDRDIARHCGCDHKTVGKYRKEMEASGDRPQMQERAVTRNGTQYQMTIPMPAEPDEGGATQAHGGTPQVYDDHMPKATLKQHKGFNRGTYSDVCEDCGDLFDYPVDGPKQTRCEPCRFEYYRQKYAPTPDGRQAEPDRDPALEYATDLDEIQHICSFCGKIFPESETYSAYTKDKFIKASICASCLYHGLAELYEETLQSFRCLDCGAPFKALAVQWPKTL